MTDNIRAQEPTTDSASQALAFLDTVMHSDNEDMRRGAYNRVALHIKECSRTPHHPPSDEAVREALVPNALAVFSDLVEMMPSAGIKRFDGGVITVTTAREALGVLRAELADNRAQEALAFSAGGEEGRAWTAERVATLEAAIRQRDAVIEQLTDALQAIEGVADGEAFLCFASVTSILSVARHALATHDGGEDE